MRKFLLTLLAIYTLIFSFTAAEFTGSVAVTAAPIVCIEPLDAVIAMLGGLYADKTLRKRSLGKQPKGKKLPPEPLPENEGESAA